MLNYKVRIGLAPCRRWLHGKRTGIFSQEYAKKVKDEIVPYIKEKFGSSDVDFVDLEFLNEEGLMFLPEQAEKIAAIRPLPAVLKNFSLSPVW